jgi:hypothetical protein
VSEGAKPAVSYWHLWTDANGVSHQTRCTMTEFEKAAVAPGAAPQWIGAKTQDTATVFVTVLPPGWTGDWHENPKPQWIIPLSGRWFVESMDGRRVEMGPGEMSFGEDKNTCKVAGKQGHRSGTLGDVPTVLMIVQLHAPAEPASPCRFR